MPEAFSHKIKRRRPRHFFDKLNEVMDMKNLLKSWIFFTSLLLLLLAAALTLPQLGKGFFGATEEKLSEAVDYISEEAQAVFWEQ